MTGTHRTWTASAEDDGRRLDVALAAWLGTSRAQAQRRIDAGQVRVDGHPAVRAQRVAAGSRVEVAPPAGPPRSEPPAPVPIRYRDPDLVVVAKPAGLVVHPGAGVRDGTLVDALAAQGVPLAPAGGHDRPGVVHRLDRGTSGLLALACTDRAHEALTRLLRERAVDRRYVALVDGVPRPERATIDAPIARDPARRTRFATDPGGREARTHYDVEERFEGAARLAVRLETGRTHQVRVHLAAIGHPVCGDHAYGASRARARALGLDRPALHAERLAFTHPLSGARIDLTEPWPPDIAHALDALRDPGTPDRT